MSYGSGKSGFTKALDRGTAPTLQETDWEAIVAICDFIRSGEIKPKYAVDSVMKKISLENQVSAQHALQILESIVKNCGPKIHEQVANPGFMDFMKKQSKLKVDSVKAKILELIQCWAHAFRDNADYKAVTETFNELKNEGVSFPQLKEADAMFAAEVLPDWKDGDNCFNCRTEFTTFTRKHHCRACGQIFCNKCSSKKSAIPKFGIEADVRVCDSCYNKLNPTSAASAPSASKQSDSELPAEYLNSALYKQAQQEMQEKKAHGGKSKEEIEEEEQLQLALAISQSEAEAKEQEKRKRQTFMSLDATPPASSLPQSSAPAVELEEDLMSPELQKYLNRNYWEQKQKEISSPQSSQPSVVKTTASMQETGNKSSYISVTTPSAPPQLQSEPSYTTSSTENQEQQQNREPEGQLEENEEEREQFMKSLSNSIDVFVNRMKSNSLRGRSIINDSSVQTLFAVLQNMHPQLLSYIKSQEDKRSHFESLQDKLAQLKDAREALNSLRQEHEEKRRIEAEERAKRKQIQMMQKLDILRKQKQQALDRQRLAAMQRLHQQEAEMKARIEQQKQLAQMRQMQLHGFPQELQAGYGNYGQLPGGDYQQMYTTPNMSGQVPGQQPLPPDMVQQVGQHGYGYDGMPQQSYQPNTQGYNPQQGYPPSQQHPYPNNYQLQSMAYNPYNMQGVSESLPSSTQSAPYSMPSQGPHLASAPGLYGQVQNAPGQMQNIPGQLSQGAPTPLQGPQDAPGHMQNMPGQLSQGAPAPLQGPQDIPGQMPNMHGVVMPGQAPATNYQQIPQQGYQQYQPPSQQGEQLISFD